MAGRKATQTKPGFRDHMKRAGKEGEAFTRKLNWIGWNKMKLPRFIPVLHEGR